MECQYHLPCALRSPKLHSHLRPRANAAIDPAGAYLNLPFESFLPLFQLRPHTVQGRAPRSSSRSSTTSQLVPDEVARRAVRCNFTSTTSPCTPSAVLCPASEDQQVPSIWIGSARASISKLSPLHFGSSQLTLPTSRCWLQTLSKPIFTTAYCCSTYTYLHAKASFGSLHRSGSWNAAH